MKKEYSFQNRFLYFLFSKYCSFSLWWSHYLLELLLRPFAIYKSTKLIFLLSSRHFRYSTYRKKNRKWFRLEEGRYHYLYHNSKLHSTIYRILYESETPDTILSCSTCLPVMLSQRILEVMMFPQDENSCSRSGWVKCFGNPDTYRLAPFIASLLGRAYDT
jgi:hypothetical protein